MNRFHTTVLVLAAFVGSLLSAGAALATEPFRLTTEIYKTNRPGTVFNLFASNKNPFEVTIRLFDESGTPLQDGGGADWQETITVNPRTTGPDDLPAGIQNTSSKVTGTVSLIVGASVPLPDGFAMDVYYSTQVTQGRREFGESPRRPLGNDTAAIDTSDIADDAIGASQIAANAVGTSELQANSVTTNEILNETITSADIGANAVTSSELAANSVTSSEIAANAVTASELATNSVTSAEIATAAVTSAEVLNESLTGADIMSNSIAGSDIADGTITSQDVSDSSLTGADIQNSSVTGTDIQNSSLTGSDILNESIGASDIAANAVGFSEIAAGAVRGSELISFRVVSVECNGSCSDLTLSQACGTGFEPVTVDCESVDEDSSGSVSCGTNNSCFRRTVSSGDSLGSFCNDGGGWDAHIYCVSTN